MVEPIPDGELLDATRTGDERALGVLFDRYKTHAFRIASRVVGGDDAEDVVGEAFVRILGAIRDGRGPTVSFRPYLNATVHNAAIDWYRRHKRLIATEVDDLVPLLIEADQSERGARDQVVRDAFASLPTRWQRVLWFSAVENLPHQEIGDLLGIAPNAVAALAIRARRGMADAYLAQYLAVTPSTECQLLARHLPGYLNGTTTPTRRDALDAHLLECPTCPVAVVELQQARTDIAVLITPLALIIAPVGVGLTGGIGVGTTLGGASGVSSGMVSSGIALKATTSAAALLVAAGAAIAGITLAHDASTARPNSTAATAPTALPSVEPSTSTSSARQTPTSAPDTKSPPPAVPSTPTASHAAPTRHPDPSPSTKPVQHDVGPPDEEPVHVSDPRLAELTTAASERGTGWHRVEVRILDAEPGVKLAVSATGGTQYCVDTCDTATETSTWLATLAVQPTTTGQATVALDVKPGQEVAIQLTLTGSGWADSNADNNSSTVTITP